MKLNIPPTLQTIDLADWNPEAKGQVIYVWVDPPSDVLKERSDFRQEYTAFMAELLAKPDESPKKEKPSAKVLQANKIQQEKQFLASVEEFTKAQAPKVHAWYAALWSEGKEDTRWTAEELAEMKKKNPNLLNWLTGRSNELLDFYRGAEKKG